jgi:hypothetical protein
MKQTINFSQFLDAFRDMGREDQFSDDAKQVLFDYLEELEDATGEEYELDVIALCCEWTEESLEEIRANYDIAEDEETIEYLDNHTYAVPVNEDTMLYQAF